MDARTLRTAAPAHKFSEAEREAVLTVANSEAFKDASPHQIVPVLAERGEYIASDLITDICQREQIQPQQLILHSDNGSPMIKVIIARLIL